MPKIENLNHLYQKLDKIRRDSERKDNGSVVVGYSASYAVCVHENLEARHNEGQQAKFLEEPARKFATEIADDVIFAMKQGVGIIKAMLVGGMRLQRESQKLVPIDTGNLKGSAFTEKE